MSAHDLDVSTFVHTLREQTESTRYAQTPPGPWIVQLRGIRRSKTDQTGEGAEIVILRGLRIRPVAAVEAWLQAARITEGHVRSCGLCGAAVARIVKQRAEAAGLDPAEISAHSLRAGFVTGQGMKHLARRDYGSSWGAERPAFAQGPR